VPVGMLELAPVRDGDKAGPLECSYCQLELKPSPPIPTTFPPPTNTATASCHARARARTHARTHTQEPPRWGIPSEKRNLNLIYISLSVWACSNKTGMHSCCAKISERGPHYL